MSKSGGVFQIDDVTRTMSKGGGAPGVPPIQVQTPPTWLAGYGPVMYSFQVKGGRQYSWTPYFIFPIFTEGDSQCLVDKRCCVTLKVRKKHRILKKTLLNCFI